MIDVDSLAKTEDIINDPSGFEAERVAQIKEANQPTEEQMRATKAPWPKSMAELTTYIDSLVQRPHSYGTCVYAMSLAAVAALNYVSGKLGTTGFQASCADLDILRQTRNLEFGQLCDFNQLLYPQYCDDKHFPSWRSILREHRKKFAELAKAKLAENDTACDEVKAHWRMLAQAG